MDPEERGVKRSHRTFATATEKVYMAVAAFQALVVGAVVFAGFGIVQANVEVVNSRSRTTPVYFANFIFAQIFSVIYIFDALRARNIIQLVLHLLFNICMLSYSILQIPQTKHALANTPQDKCGSYPTCFGPGSMWNVIQKLYIVNPIVMGLSTIAFAAMIKKLYEQFGWAVFHLVGASPAMKRNFFHFGATATDRSGMHREYQILLSLLKMLLFFATAFCIAYAILVTNPSRETAEFVITIIALPLVPIGVLATGWALRKELKTLMGVCLFSMVVGLVYFIYKFASMFLPNTSGLYSNTKITMAIFSVFAILILVATFAYGCLCMSNFGKGLLQAHQNPENKTSLWALNSNIKHQEKVRADVHPDKPIPETERIVID